MVYQIAIKNHLIMVVFSGCKSHFEFLVSCEKSSKTIMTSLQGAW